MKNGLIRTESFSHIILSFLNIDVNLQGDFNFGFERNKIARLSHDYFKPISDRVKFVSYDKLDRYYEGLMTQKKSSLVL